jgi:hypothetical protein
MKKIILCISLLALSLIANAEKPLAKNIEKPQTKTQQPKLNPLETALDFEKGTKEFWTDFKEEGGLEKFNNWYGIQVAGLTLQRGGDGLISSFILNVNPYSTVTIKQLRATINAYCGLTNADWKNDDMSMEDRYSARASNDRCQTASFDNFVNGRKVWSITLSKVKY